ncbi:hypothetical protein ACKWTF_005084 [Chironomus riparius]
MNDNVSETFHCNEIGCQMSFYTEQNLSAHRQVKHNKLNLDIPPKDATISFSDQTPTPTRLLNKCEELRVFDDPYIQNLNPFDEGFRKAINDDHQCGYLTTLSSNQDTLHTPQIIPDFISRVIKEEKLKHEVLLPIQDEPENLSTTPDIPKYTINDHHDHHPVERSHLQPIPLLPKPNIMYSAPIITNTASMHLNSTLNDHAKSSESVKDKLKNIILNNNSTGTTTITDGSKRIKMDSDSNLPAILIQTVPLISPANFIISNNNDEDSKLRITASNNGISNSINLKPLEIKKPELESSTKKRTVPTNKDSSSKSNTKLDSVALKIERNREAARRYRNKIKIQSLAIKDKYDRSQKEISQLKKEVTELKKLLLLHKDCDITKNSRMS